MSFLGTAWNIAKNKIKNQSQPLIELWNLRQNPDYFYVLRHMNPTRINYILPIIHKAMALKPKDSVLRILDIGCGIGLVSGEIAKIFGSDIMIDAIDENWKHIMHAKEINHHANICYHHANLKDFCLQTKSQYDLIIALEVIEHVDNKVEFIDNLRELNPRYVVFSTLNRSIISYLGGIVMAEKILKLLPHNTHQHHQFITPMELAEMLEKKALLIKDLQGIWFNPITQKVSLNRCTKLDYIGYAASEMI